MELDYVAIGKRLQKARNEAKLTQEQLSEKVSISVPHISNIETGKSNVSLVSIVNLANALSVTVDDLLCDNLIHARLPFEKEVRDVLDNCSPYQLCIICSSIKGIYRTLCENEKYFDIQDVI